MRTYIYMLKKVDSAAENSGFEKQLKLLDKVSPSKDSFSYSGSQPNNETKNRYRTYVPPDERRVLLKGRQSQGSASAYICAMFVDGYRQKNSYIATQGPLKHTVEDFWQLIWENNIEFIVMMTRLEENGEEMSAQYWPFKGTETYGLVSVTLKSEKMLQNYMIRKFRITNRLESETSKNVTQFHYLNWPVGQLPDTHSELLHMMNEILRLQQQSENKTVVVVCNDGVHRCALFCAISIVLETLKTEQIVDIFQIVKALRLQNPHFVTSLMEYEFCYNITLVFLESFEEYANFKLL
jgi:receptor-type tyrosine-protein phosphatase A